MGGDEAGVYGGLGGFGPPDRGVGRVGIAGGAVGRLEASRRDRRGIGIQALAAATTDLGFHARDLGGERFEFAVGLVAAEAVDRPLLGFDVCRDRLEAGVYPPSLGDRVDGEAVEGGGQIPFGSLARPGRVGERQAAARRDPEDRLPTGRAHDQFTLGGDRHGRRRGERLAGE